MRGAGLALLACAAAALLLIGGAGATTPPPATNLSVTALFSNAVQPVSPSSTWAAAYCPPSAPTSTNGCTGTHPPYEVRWGQPAVSGGQRSGLNFMPTSPTSTPLDTPFVVGTLTHLNYPIVNPITSVDLTVTLKAQTALDGDLTFTLPFTLGIDETPNETPCPFLVQPTDTPCPDKITLPSGSIVTSVASGGRTYQLRVIGFTTSPTNVTSPASELITQENSETSGYLVAELERTNTAPVAVDDPGNTTVSGGSDTVDVLANDTDADGDALTPIIETQPAHGTAVVNPDGTITYTANLDYAGPDSFTYRASDGFAESATAATVSFTVTDTTKPTITVPSGGVSVEATGPTTPVTYTVSADDNVDGTLTPSCDPASGSSFPVGTTTVTCTATDAAGNTGTETFDVTITDTTPPTIDGVPSSTTVEATGPNGAAVAYTAPTATDLVDGDVAVTCQPQSGATFPLGADTVTCTATDSHGNTATGTFTVTVQDTTPPTVTVPSDMTVFSAGGASVAVTFPSSASDLVDGTLPTTCDPASGSTFAVGTTKVTCTATDASGNTGSASFSVTVVANRPPVCSAVTVTPATIWSPNNKLVLVTLQGATDPDGDAVAYRIDGVTQNEPGSDWQRASGGSVYVRATRLGSGNGRVYTIAYTVSDPYGATCSGTVKVTVPHDQR